MGRKKLVNLHEEIGRDFVQSIGKRPWWQWEAVESLYDGAIHQLDSSLNNLINELKDAGEFDNTLLIVTSDHGEGFGESDRIIPGLRIANHNYGIHEVLTHVPLVVKWPRQNEQCLVSKFAAIKDFPSAVKTALRGKREDSAFIPEGPVFSSTYRAKTIDTTPKSDNRKDYLGPWRAAYTLDDDRQIKFADRNEESATIAILDAQTSYQIKPTDNGRTEDLYERIEDKKMTEGLGHVDNSVEEKLSDLGYLR